MAGLRAGAALGPRRRWSRGSRRAAASARRPRPPPRGRCPTRARRSRRAAAPPRPRAHERLAAALAGSPLLGRAGRRAVRVAVVERGGRARRSPPGSPPRRSSSPPGGCGATSGTSARRCAGRTASTGSPRRCSDTRRGRNRRRIAASWRKVGRADMPLSRRQFLQATAVAGATLVAAPGRAPAFVRSRPVLTHGVQSGEVAMRSGVVWTRADRPSRMLVQVLDGRHGRRPQLDRRAGPDRPNRLHGQGAARRASPRPARRVPRRAAGPPQPGGAERAAVAGRSGPRRPTRATSRSSGARTSPARAGASTPTSAATASSGRWPTLQPDFFLCSGDTIYADGPLTETVALPDGRVVAQRRDAGEGQGRRDARRVPRPVRLQPARREPARVRARGRRSSTSGTTTRSSTTGTRARSSTTRATPSSASTCSPPAPSRRSSSGCRSASAERGRIYRKLSYGPLLDVFVLDMRTYKDPNDGEPLRRPAPRAPRRARSGSG